MIPNIRNHPGYRIILWLLLIISVFFLWSLNNSILNSPSLISSQDYSQFWAAGRLVLEGENPYNPESINRVKNSVSGMDEDPQIVAVAFNPPWVIPIFLPFALIDYPLSRLIWLIITIIVLIYSAELLWRIYGGSKEKRWVPILLTFLFGPTILVLRQGQITPFVLIGIAGFLYLIKYDRNDWLAGVFAALISIKPQLFYLFWFAFLFWVIHHKRWKVFTSFILALGLSTLLISLISPNVIPNYMRIILNYSPTVWITPTIGSYLRLIFGWEKSWLQFIAPIIGIIWFLIFWFKNHNVWDWVRDMPRLVLVSLLSMPFGWTYDYVLALAAIVPAAVLWIHSESRNSLILCSIGYLMLNALYLVMHRYYTDGYFGWLLPGLIIMYWFSIQRTGGYNNLAIIQNEKQ